MPAKENNKDSKMPGRWRKDADRIGNVAKHLRKIMFFCLESAYYSKAHISQNSQ